MAPPGPRIWLSETLVHTEIGVPTSALRGKLAGIATGFPASEVLTFGFGKRDYFLASEPRILATFLAPIPGLGAMEVGSHPAAPAGALSLGISVAGLGRLLAAIEASFAGESVLHAAQSGHRYFAAAHFYTLAYTCNTWTAEMLSSAGLPFRPRFVMTAQGVMNQASGGCREGLTGQRSLRT